MNSWPPGVAEKLKHYVYRLIDPLNNETFYVGKGVGDPVFHHTQHANTLINDEGSENSVSPIKGQAH